MRHPLRRTAGVALLFLPLVVGCGDEPQPVQEVVRPVKILEIGAGGSGGRREYPGTIKAATTAELAFEVQGRLTDFPVQEGQQVEAGAVLAKIDPRDYEAAVDKAQARLNDAKSDYDRAKELFDRGVTPKAELEKRQRHYEVTAADLREARKALDEAVLRAPFRGTVARKLVDDFQNLQAKQPVVVLEDASSLEIQVDVPERDIALGSGKIDLEETTERLQPEVSLTAAPDRLYPARLKEFSTRADPATRTFRATLAFDRPATGAVLPGMTATVSIRASGGAGGGLRIPVEAAVSDESGQAFVWRVDPDSMRVSRVPVTLGAMSGGEVEVRTGLSNGDWVVVSGIRHLQEGMQVSRMGS